MSAIFYDKDVRARIEENRNELENNIAQGKLFLPGYQMAKAAGPSLYDSLGGFVRDMRGGQEELAGEAEFLHLKPGEIYARTDDKHGNGFRNRRVLATRSPYAVGSSIEATNIYYAETPEEQLRKEQYEKAAKLFKHILTFTLKEQSSTTT